MFKERIQLFLNQHGYQIKKTTSLDPSMEEEFKLLHAQCLGLHLQSVERLYALYQACHYILKNHIAGDIVECGVYKGASIVLAAHVLKAAGQEQRKFFLYDTFEGWPEPAPEDKVFAQTETLPITSWDRAEIPSLETVWKNVLSTKYPKEKFVFVKGKVEDTIPASVPDKIALLRLDTDGYTSTRHELDHLYPRLSNGGILIIDDYGHWQGSKKAVDDYFREHNITMLLNRIDYTGRMGIKTGSA